MLTCQKSRIGAASACTAEDGNLKDGNKVTLYVATDNLPTAVDVAYLNTNGKADSISLRRELHNYPVVNASFPTSS